MIKRININNNTIETEISSKYPIRLQMLVITKGNIKTIYKLKAMEWNFFLNCYYPKAVKVITIEHLKQKRRKPKN